MSSFSKLGLLHQVKGAVVKGVQVEGSVRYNLYLEKARCYRMKAQRMTRNDYTGAHGWKSAVTEHTLNVPVDHYRCLSVFGTGVDAKGLPRHCPSTCPVTDFIR